MQQPQISVWPRVDEGSKHGGFNRLRNTGHGFRVRVRGREYAGEWRKVGLGRLFNINHAPRSLGAERSAGFEVPAPTEMRLS